MAKQEKIKTDSFEDIAFETIETLEDGLHTGVISEIHRNKGEFDYTQYKIAVDGSNVKINLSFPTRITFSTKGEPSSEHAKFLSAFGFGMDSDKPYADIRDELIGKKVSFMTIQKKTDKGTFAEIVKESVKAK